MNNTLRPYQNDALQAMSSAFKRGIRSLMLMCPTGSGKTVMATKILNNVALAGKRAVIVCDRIELINQTSTTLKNNGINHGVIMADHELTSFRKNIQVASIQTLARRQKLEVDVIIIDEAHVIHKAHLRLIKDNPKAVVLGLSATPFSKGLGKIFKELITVVTTEELIIANFLVRPVVYAPSKPDLEKIKISKGDYDNTELADKVNTPQLIGEICEHWIKLAYNRPTICFAINVAHSKSIQEEFQKRGINCQHLDAFTDKDDRKDIIADFKAGHIKVLTSVDILSKGFDYPGAEVAILARPTKSLSLYIQQAGRVLRISPATGKKDCLILDHAGNTESHGFITDPLPITLCMGNKATTSPLKRDKTTPVATACPGCAMVKNTFTCENCGFEFKTKTTVVNAEGFLIQLTEDEDDIFGFKKKITATEFFIENRTSLYGELKQLCIEKDWKPGRAYFMFKDIVKEEPTWADKNAEPRPPSKKTISMIKHLNIKKAKSKYVKQT